MLFSDHHVELNSYVRGIALFPFPTEGAVFLSSPLAAFHAAVVARIIHEAECTKADPARFRRASEL